MADSDEKKKYKVNVFGQIPLEDQVQSPAMKVFRYFAILIDSPTVWFKENIVDKYRGPAYPYYHRKFPRVPDISECYTDDLACIFEADKQFERDRKVDMEIFKIIKNRYFRCSFYERPVNDFQDIDHLCLKEKKDMKEAELNLFIKYGELGPYQSVIGAFMRQKHRLIFERRQKERTLKFCMKNETLR